MTRVVFDTNIFISALIFGGVPSQLMKMGTEGKFRILTSPVLLDELDEKLRLKFASTPSQADAVRNDLERSCEVVSTTPHLQVIHDDPDDDRVLECALSGHADYIVSGDKHLLKLKSFKGIDILTVRQFLDLLNPIT